MSPTPYYIIIVALLMTPMALQAQGNDSRHLRIDSLRRQRSDSLRSDYEEWLRNEPLKPSPRDSQTLAPLPPSMPLPRPEQLAPQHPKVSINIMTPAFKTELQLAYQSHQLEEMRKQQQGGAMMVGVSPLSLIGFVLQKIFPSRKSKKEREREKLQRVLDNY